MFYRLFLLALAITLLGAMLVFPYMTSEVHEVDEYRKFVIGRSLIDFGGILVLVSSGIIIRKKK